MKTYAVFLLFFTAAPAFAGSCKGSYSCTSASGKYKIDIEARYYDNDMGCTLSNDYDPTKAATVTEDGKAVEGAALTAGWDGPEFGAFEIRLPGQGNTRRHISVEFTKKTGKGTLHYETKTDDPDDWHDVKDEPIHCEGE